MIRSYISTYWHLYLSWYETAVKGQPKIRAKIHIYVQALTRILQIDFPRVHVIMKSNKFTLKEKEKTGDDF